MQKVYDYIRKYHMIEPGDHILVGVSGGADSLCLLFVLRNLQNTLPFTITAVHVEHGIRGEDSLADAEFVRTLCEEQKIDFLCVSVDAPKAAKDEHLSLEEAARKLRYDSFRTLLKEKGYQKIAVAHHKNDQTETMLFQMARGSGLKGAGGIQPVNGNVIRPLLCLERGEIENYLKEQGIAWRTDATNASTEYARNCLRREVLPILKEKINAKTVAHFSNLAEELQETEKYLQTVTEEKFAAVSECMESEVRLECSALLKEPELLQRRILRLGLACVGCSAHDLTREHVDAMRGLLFSQSGKSCDLPGGFWAWRQFDRLILQKKDRAKPVQAGGAMCGNENSSVPDPAGAADHENKDGFCVRITGDGTFETPLGTFACRVFPAENKNIFQNTYTKWLDYDKINGELMLRTKRPGDYLVVNREGGTKKLKRYLIEEKIPVEERKTVPVLAAGEEILWVVGHRIGERCKVSDQTKKIFEIRKMGEEPWQKK